MKRRLFLLVAVVSFWTQAAWAALIINVGSHDLLPNMPGQPVQVFVQGGDLVQGVDFNIQIADGQDSTAAPVFQAWPDVISATIFATNNSGPQPGNFLMPHLAYAGVTTSSGTVSANGLLGTVLIDTTGFFSGTWSLTMSNTLNGDTMFSGLGAQINEGSIRIIPEPSSLLLLAMALTAGAVFGLRRRIGPR